MTEVFVGQIILSGFMFPPRNFALCNGQVLPISQNQALFSLLGVNYGGNGTTNFCLPDLRGRTPVGYGTSRDASWQPAPYPLGTPGGVETVTLTTQNLPTHTHQANGTPSSGSQRNPINAFYGNDTSASLYAPSDGAQVALAPDTLAVAGGNGPHDNMQPYAVISYSIALAGVYPSRS